MRIKKLLQGMAVTALAAAAWAGAGSAGASASIGINAIDVDENDQKIIVTPGDNREVIFGVAKKGTNRKSGKTTFKISAWDVHDVNGATKIKMDLSKLNAAKDNFIAVMTGDMDIPYIIRIPASDKVNVLTYNAQKHELEFLAGSSKRNAVAAKKFQYRIPGGSWTEKELEKGVIKDVFSEYQCYGASLYVRTCAVDKALEADTYYSDAYDASNLDNKLPVYVSGTLPGKISKLNIAKQANGPSVSVQYAAGTLTLPKAAEYRVLTAEEAKETTTKETTEGTTKNIEYKFKKFDVTENGETKQLEIAPTNATKATKGVRADVLLGSEAAPATSGAVGILEVRTKAKVNDSSPKRAKCASKWTRINLEVTAPLSNEELGGEAIITSASSVDAASGGAGVKYAVVKDEKGEKTFVSVAYGDSKYDDSIKTWKGTIRFTNIGSDDYQIVVSDKEVTNVSELPTTGVKTLAAGNTSTKIVNLTNVERGKFIYIRKAGNQSKKKWAGVYRLFGIADIPET